MKVLIVGSGPSVASHAAIIRLLREVDVQAELIPEGVALAFSAKPCFDLPSINVLEASADKKKSNNDFKLRSHHHKNKI